MKVYIQTSTGLAEVYKFDVETSTTVQQLKQLFVEKSGDDQDIRTMCFIYKGSMLDDDDETLAEYNITDRCVLQLVDLSLISRNDFAGIGAKFVDLSSSKGLTKQTWSKTGPRWRIASPGLCLEGTCVNDQCEAHNQRVVIRIGYKRFDLIVGADESTSICPVCRKYVDPETCAFNNCWWKYEGVRQDVVGKGIPPKKYASDWQHADNAYYYFDQKTSGVVLWRQLIIEVVKNKPQ